MKFRSLVKGASIASFALAMIPNAAHADPLEWLGRMMTSSSTPAIDAATRSAIPSSVEAARQATQVVLSRAQAMMRAETNNGITVITFTNMLNVINVQPTSQFLQDRANDSRLARHVEVSRVMAEYINLQADLIAAHNQVMSDFTALLSISPRTYAHFDFSAPADDRPMLRTAFDQVETVLTGGTLQLHRGALVGATQRMLEFINKSRPWIEDFERTNGPVR